MAGYNFGSPPKINRLDFSKFKGVDFQTNPLEMNFGRTPNSRNMLIDKSGYPVKRTGYKQRLSIAGKKINGIYTLKTDEFSKTLIHAGTDLYEWNKETDTLSAALTTAMNDARSLCFQKDSKLYIIDGGTYRCYYKDGASFVLKTVEEMAFVPTTVISRNPDGTGGTSFQAVNLLSKKRTNSFLGKASVTEYVLDSKGLDAEAVTARKMTSSGVWQDLTETTDFTVDRAAGKVTFSVAPGASPVTGMDNVEIRFAKTVSGYADKINKTTIFDIFTIGAGDYFFLAGNPAEGNRDYRSNVNDPTYFPDTGYSIVGQDNTDIMCYIKINSSQAIIKESNEQDVSIYLRNSATDANGKVTFPIISGITSSGCISKYATINLKEDKLFLSKDGVSSLVTSILGVNMSQGRSYYIEPHLLQRNMAEAVAIEFEGRYLLAVDGYVYVADSRLKEFNKYSGTESYQYEWTLWDNMPVRVWHKDRDYLYFGTVDGKIMQMQKDDGRNFTEFYDDIDTPVRCYWDTPYIDFGTISRNKNMKGLWVVLQPNVRTSCDIYYKTRDTIALSPNYTADMVIPNDTAFADMFDFGSIDFTRFSFLTNDGPHVVSTNRKEKKFSLMQLRFENKNSEPMGIYKVQIEYTISSKYKGR